MSRRKAEESAPGSPAWMATYSDLVTLLLCFFVLLYGMSSINVEKFNSLAAALSNSSMSIIESGAASGVGVMIGNGILEMPKMENSTEGSVDDFVNDAAQQLSTLDELRQLAADFETYFAENNLSDIVSAELDNGAINITFKDGMLFDSGSADIKPTAMQTLDFIANELLQHENNEIEIVGHTDSVPINTAQFQDNWFLSAARAIHVGQFFIDVKGFSPGRISAVGKGEFQPIAPNDTMENRAKNRRVEIKIRSTSSSSTGDLDSIQ